METWKTVDARGLNPLGRLVKRKIAELDSEIRVMTDHELHCERQRCITIGNAGYLRRAEIIQNEIKLRRKFQRQGE